MVQLYTYTAVNSLHLMRSVVRSAHRLDRQPATGRGMAVATRGCSLSCLMQALFDPQLECGCWRFCKRLPRAAGV